MVTASPATPQTRPDAIVIGSGFGGAVSACRLAESGRKVLILERGKYRNGNDFPRLPDAKPSDWLWNSRWNGFFDLKVFRHMLTLTSSGVGGGSHVYANVHLRASRESFYEGWPEGMGAETLTPYYERAERMLGVRPLPEAHSLAKTTAFEAAADRIGAKRFRPNLAVYFGEGANPEPPPPDQPPAYVRDPYKLGIDIEQSPCRHCGECDIGCRYNAKNTLDLNYLAVAQQQHGAVLQPQCEVYAISPEADGYRVYYRDRLNGERESVWAPLVVVAAGTVNSTELLLRCRDEYGLLPKLSSALGEHFSGNGDFLCAALNTKEQLHPWHGPVITTALEFTDAEQHFYLQEGGFAPELSFMVASLRPNSGYFGKMLRGPVGAVARLHWFERELSRMAGDRERLARSLPTNSMIFLGMGRDASDGRIMLKKRLGRRPALDIAWEHAGTQPLIDRMEVEFRKIATELGGTYVANPVWSLLNRMVTVHPLGGCAVADDAERGVLTPYGEVWGYPNLYVADGAAVPRGIGPNPSLTISALAERTAEQIVRG
ncbi:MAG: GMC family oxidoreductase N-terminal domain-containing protein [Dehalococcoidia bacterium]